VVVVVEPGKSRNKGKEKGPKVKVTDITGGGASCLVSAELTLRTPRRGSSGGIRGRSVRKKLEKNY